LCYYFKNSSHKSSFDKKIPSSHKVVVINTNTKAVRYATITFKGNLETIEILKTQIKELNSEILIYDSLIQKMKKYFSLEKA